MPRCVEEFFDEIVLFVVERGAAQMRHAKRAIDDFAVGSFRFPVLVARLLHALGDHFHRLLQRNRLPRGGMWTAIENLLFARSCR